MSNIKLFLILGLLFCVSAIDAQLKLASVLGDNMVLQRNTEVKLWGKCNPNEKITITTSWNKIINSANANSKGEWLVKVKTTEAGGPYEITFLSKKEKVVLKNILFGEVWLCSGQSNMEMPLHGFTNQPINGNSDFLMDADNNNIRMCKIGRMVATTPQDTCVGQWKISSAESAATFSAVAYLFAKQLHDKLKVPIGVIATSWGGTRIEPWMNLESLKQFPDAYNRASQPKILPHLRPASLYNGMIAPFVNYVIKGAIWYQGESNIPNYKEYSSLMKGMVEGWRKDFAIGEFPFYYVQIAPYYYFKSSNNDAAFLREEQEKAMSIIPNSGMICTLDIGEEKSIHPAEKFLVAKRLASWALAKDYGFSGLLYKSPSYKNITVKDSLVTITFDNVSVGFTSYGKSVDCFQIAGSDKVFYPAQITTTKNNEVLITSANVKFPVAVRYGFTNFPTTKGYLFSTIAQPVLPFRTDNWDK